MSLPNYLAKIKSSGVYRYVFDKSQVPSQEAETLRLVVGYSEKGPFNTPVYIDNKKDFITLYGNINKRLEKKGIFFHRMALQALSAGPILAFNAKPFTASGGVEGTAEQVSYLAFDPWDNMTVSNDLLVDSSNSAVMDKLDVLSLYDTNRFWKLDEDQLPTKINTGKYINIVSTDIKDTSCTIFIRPCKPSSYDVSFNDWFSNITDAEIPAYLEDYMNRKLNEFFAEIYVFRGKFTYDLCKSDGTLGAYFDQSVIGTSENPNIVLNNSYQNSFGESVDALEALANDNNSNFIASYQGCLLPYFQDANGNYISLDVLFNQDNFNHKMLMKLDDGLIDAMLEDHFETKIVNDYSNYYPATRPLYLEGYTYGSVAKNDTPENIQKTIFDNVFKMKGIYTALTNRVDCEYHYIVDTFASYLGQGCKNTLSGIAKAKDNAFAILNFPAMSQFLSNKSYIGDNGFDIKKIAEYKAKFSLPMEVDGASWCAFYTPVVFSDGTMKTTVPSAALVSNLYMEKWNSRQPYYIVAGPNYGRIEYEGLIGPDYNYCRTDLDVLEPLGVNVIIYVPRKGTYINSNQTAKQTPVTALSKAHVRELVIYLQDEIESMLQNYQWELNTSTLRDVVKTKADTILENVKNNGGVYAYLNVCDESNNTPEAIDNEMIILDTSIEPARGAGKMVQRLTIHRTGGISSLTK